MIKCIKKNVRSQLVPSETLNRTSRPSSSTRRKRALLDHYSTCFCIKVTQNVLIADVLVFLKLISHYAIYLLRAIFGAKIVLLLYILLRSLKFSSKLPQRFQRGFKEKQPMLILSWALISQLPRKCTHLLSFLLFFSFYFFWSVFSKKFLACVLMLRNKVDYI